MDWRRQLDQVCEGKMVSFLWHCNTKLFGSNLCNKCVYLTWKSTVWYKFLFRQESIFQSSGLFPGGRPMWCLRKGLMVNRFISGDIQIASYPFSFVRLLVSFDVINDRASYLKSQWFSWVVPSNTLLVSLTIFSIMSLTQA